jgi:hypothetical protein
MYGKYGNLISGKKKFTAAMCGNFMQLKSGPLNTKAAERLVLPFILTAFMGPLVKESFLALGGRKGDCNTMEPLSSLSSSFLLPSSFHSK